MIREKDMVLIAELRRRYRNQDTTNFGVSDFLSAFGSPVDAVMYLRLFWPNFVRLEGMVFRQEILEDDDDRRRVLDALSRFRGDKNETERSFNLVDVPFGLFSRHASESSDCIDAYLAESIVELWTHRLATAFPEEEFVVQAVSPEENGGEWGVTFWTRYRQS